MKVKYTKLLALAVVVPFMGLAGCASQAELDEVRGIAERAQSTANQALQEAQACSERCAAVEEKVDRMFQEGLRK